MPSPTARSDRSHQYHATPATYQPCGLASIAALANAFFAIGDDALTTLAALAGLKEVTVRDGYDIGEVSTTGNGVTSFIEPAFSRLVLVELAFGVAEAD